METKFTGFVKQHAGQVNYITIPIKEAKRIEVGRGDKVEITTRKI